MLNLLKINQINIMRITITPEDIIKRCLWNPYKYFILKDKKDSEITKIINNNHELELSEEDAFVIGLLKTVISNNLINHFSNHIIDVVQNKSIVSNNRVFIGKPTILKEVINFKSNFPEDYNGDKKFVKSVDALNTHINKIYKQLEELETISVQIKDKSITCLVSNDVQRIITKNNV